MHLFSLKVFCGLIKRVEIARHLNDVRFHFSMSDFASCFIRKCLWRHMVWAKQHYLNHLFSLLNNFELNWSFVDLESGLTQTNVLHWATHSLIFAKCSVILSSIGLLYQVYYRFSFEVTIYLMQIYFTLATQ